MRVDPRWSIPIVLAAAAAVAWGVNGGSDATAVDAAGIGRLTVAITAGAHWLRGEAGAAGRPLSEEAETGAPDDEAEPTDDAEGAEPIPSGDGPQMALWLEDADGGYVSTIYVTRRAAFEDWLGVTGLAEREAARRPLPVWAGKHREIGVEPMAACAACHGKRRSDDKAVSDDPILEGLTGRAPSSGFSLEWAVPERVGPGTYRVRAEVNHWADPNDRYAVGLPEDDPNQSGGRPGSGQPSLIWEGIVEIGADPNDCDLVVIGHGHPAGLDGEIDPDLTGLTTALSIVDTIRVGYTPVR